MKVRIVQERFEWNYTYQIYINDEKIYLVKANRTILPTRRRVCICDTNEQVLYTLKEHRLWFKFISRLPLFKGLTRFFKKQDEYVVINKNNVIGDLQTYDTSKSHYVEFKFEERTFKIYKKMDELKVMFPIFKEDTQIGLFEKSRLTYWSASEYTGELKDEVNPLVHIMSMIFIDLTEYTTDQDEIRETTYEHKWMFGNKNKQIKLNQNFKVNRNKK